MKRLRAEAKPLDSAVPRGAAPADPALRVRAGGAFASTDAFASTEAFARFTVRDRPFAGAEAADFSSDAPLLSPAGFLADAFGTGGAAELVAEDGMDGGAGSERFIESLVESLVEVAERPTNRGANGVKLT